MKGAINYLTEVKSICTKHKGDCRMCPLGEQTRLEDTLCPRLTNPKSWDNEKIRNMIKYA